MPPKRAAESNGKKSKKAKKSKEYNSSDCSSDSEGGEGAAEEETETTKNDDEEEQENDAYASYRNEVPSQSGEILFCGASNWDLVGRSKLPKGMKNVGGLQIWSPNRISSLKGIKIHTVASGCNAAHCVAISSEGTTFVWGRNENGQLGLGHTKRVDTPTEVEALADMNCVAAACGRRHTLFLSEKGKVYSCGDNKLGQLGNGYRNDGTNEPRKVRYSGPPVRRIACGAEFSVMSDMKGNVYTFGCPEYGQTGHNTDGKYFITSSKMDFQTENSPRVVTVYVEKARDGTVTPLHDVDAREIACGTNHTIMLDSKKRVFSWGFGGYGRLGHSDPKDVMVPQSIQFFAGPNRGAQMIAAGSTYSMAVSEHGALFLWGVTKVSGEASMYPKNVQDLMGWKVRSIGTSNKSIVIAADDSLISFGPSPTFGELGYGPDIKSSTTAKEVKPVNDCYILEAKCGFSHTLLIARTETDEDNAAIDELPVFTPITS